MDRDSTLLEEAYLRIAEMYYGYDASSYDDREEPDNISTFEELSFFLPDPINIGNKTYIVHFFCDGASASGSPNAENKKDIDFTYDDRQILIWNSDKTPEIWTFFNEGKDKPFVDNLTDEIINAAIISYPDKNPDFITKYKNHPLYGKIIKEIWEIADEIMWDKWVADAD
jgi:hypothetical protein